MTESNENELQNPQGGADAKQSIPTLQPPPTSPPPAVARALHALTHEEAGRINQHLTGDYVNAGELIAPEVINDHPYFVRGDVAVALGEDAS